jgi:hypothetical protein
MTSARSIRKATLLGLLACASLCGCVGAPSDAQSLNGGNQVVQSSESGLVNATVTLEAAALERGQNSFLVVLQPVDDAGEDVPVLTSAVATMPAHGHSVTATTIAPDGSAYRVGDLDLFMSGLWQVDLTVTVGARSDHVEFSLDVP